MNKRPGLIVPPTVEISTISDASSSSPQNEEEEGNEERRPTERIHPPLRRRPVSAMASLPCSRLTYQASRERDDRDDGDEDEDCAVESTLFLSTSPSIALPATGSVSSLALSPPGLSPLNFNDGSPFSLSSTPSSSSSFVNRSRFTFDHVPFVGSSTNSTPATASTAASGSRKSAAISPNIPIGSSVSTEKSAFEVVSKHEKNADEVLQRVRLGTSCSSNSNTYKASPGSIEQITSSTTPTATVTSVQDATSTSENKQYYCHVCKKDFKRPDILSRHLRRHTGEKPFGCDACGRFFSRSDHLRTHRRTHTDEKPYQCSICNYSARRRDVLTRHMATRHQAKAPQGSHRNVRRCLSDGDYHTMALHHAHMARHRHLTTVRGDAGQDVEIPPMEDIEDDVIVDD